MHHWTKRMFAIAAPLLLTGCLWGPGKFNSELTLKKDGSFALDYRGEMVLQLPPDEAGGEPWKPELAKCFEGMENKTRSQSVVLAPGAPARKERKCTAAEVTAQKSDYEQNTTKRGRDAEQMAKLFGLPGLDDASNRAFAAKLTKYAGWRSVSYRGKGVFDVDYHFVGRSTQDFLFPALPDNDLIVPFIAIRRRADGSVLVTAPGFTGGTGPLAARAGQTAANGMKDGPVSRAQGRFTVVTDGEILTNNSEDGAAPHPAGRQLHWDVGPASNKIPETLIRL
jgi:hypothetical protein